MGDARERPILFSGPMVRAILDGRKTQTRRVLDGRGCSIDELDDGRLWPWVASADGWLECPYGRPGDRLWVREAWAKACEVGDEIEYRADNHDPTAARWRPSIHMPRWACRIVLAVTAVRIERLQEISEVDAVAEGIRLVTKDGTVNKFCAYDQGDHSSTPWAEMQRDAVSAYRDLWDAINAKRAGCSWAANPWVWMIEFRRVEEVARG